jgi:hypothetical protein
MKTTVNTFILLLIAFLTIQCGGSQEKGNEQELPQNSQTDGTAASETYYVLATAGLRMRAEPSLESKELEVIKYGEKVQINSADASKPMTINGVRGRMFKTFYKETEGYTFEGYLSSIPVPEKGQNPADYASQLKQKGYGAKYDEVEKEMGLEEALSIPAKSLQEAFLIGQRLNIFEVDFDLPDNAAPKSIVVRTKGKTQTAKPTDEKEGYSFTVPVEEGDTYWFKTIDLAYDKNNELNSIAVQAGYEGGSWICALEKDGNFYVFRKNSTAD